MSDIGLPAKKKGGAKAERSPSRLQLAAIGMEAEFSLSDRSDLRYPVLIGRTLLQGNFVVDVSRKNISHRKKLKQKQKPS